VADGDPGRIADLEFSPWTGWLIFDEFDLLVLAMFAAGYARLAHEESIATGPVGAEPLVQ
jgi:hypothetical protein